MPFVNELISEEDISKQGFDELKKFYDPWAWRDGRPPGFIYSWTVDRQRQIFFIPIYEASEVGRSGREEPTSRRICLLDLVGKRVKLVIERAAGSSSVLSDSPFRIIWDLLELDLSQVPNEPKGPVIEIIKEALTTYGHMGVHLQAAHTKVEFRF